MYPAERRKHYEQEILTILLEKYEHSLAAVGGAGRRPQFRLLKSKLAAAYTDEMDLDQREAIHAAAQELAQQGLIHIVWERHGTGHIERILLAADAPQLYARMGRTMPLVRVEEYRASLSVLDACPLTWVRALCSEAGELLARNKLPAFLPKETDVRENLIRAILALPSAVENSIPKRVFSQHIFGDSKYFEQSVEAPLLRLLRRFAEEPCESDAEYLDMAGISVHQGKLWIAGKMAFSLHGSAYSLADFPGGIGLTYDTIASMEVDALPRSVLTVENLTNAEVLARDGGADQLLIYTAGFPNRTVQTFLQKIAALHTSAEMRHWGDLDYGGIRIFEYLRAHFFPALIPYRMGVEDFYAYLSFAHTLTDMQRKRLMTLLERTEFSAWHELIHTLLHEGKWLEQEVMLLEI